MSGPMQWTAAGFVPAVGVVPNPGEMKGGFVASDVTVAQDVQQQAPRQQVLKAAAKPAPKNIVTLAKARLREVKAELRRLKALEKEKGELERLIAAAKNKPLKSNLREIKRSAG